MEASASPGVDADFDKVCGFFLKIENSTFPTSLKQRNTVIKYTKLPEFDFDSKASWPQQSYTLQPRLRRIITLDDPNLTTTRSLKPGLIAPPVIMASSYSKRKIVTITEDDENDLHPKFSKELRKSASTRTSHRAVETDFKDDKQSTKRTTSRLHAPSKYYKETKPSAKINTENNRKETYVSKFYNRSKYSSVYNQTTTDVNKIRNIKEKEIVRNSKSANVSPKISVSKKLVTPSESENEVCLIKSKLIENFKSNITSKRPLERSRLSRSPSQQNRTKSTFLKEMKNKNKPVTVIHVPLDEKYQKHEVIQPEITQSMLHPSIKEINKVDCGTEVDKVIHTKDVNIGTDPLPKTIDQITEMENIEMHAICKCIEDTHVQEELIKKTFDSLDIPNVTLTKDKIDIPKEEIVNICSQSLPNLKAPSFKINPKDENKINNSSYCKSASYIIGRATLTYTTKQKINFHVVGSNDETTAQLTPNPLTYPLNVVSVFKNEIKNQKLKDVTDPVRKYKSNKSSANNINYMNELKALNCSYIFNSDKLVKPSDIIGTIRINNGLLQSDYICEQFQRELNFIDSFFESLQYLENCSLCDKCVTDHKVENWISNIGSPGFNVKNPDYSSFLSKFENSANIDDSETIASKSLCLLNLLIRDEQRRAKNLLFVLKMREDALKDFTKSQIIWLENKKKQDNTDIPTLKKKQRGALLKLQHECGEMQRMRKALLTLSEKRKAALIKTKKNIELKLKNNIDVDQILLGKKKLKRNTPGDRNVAPLKCFDLSSSGCDDSTASKARSDKIPVAAAAPSLNPSITCAEKCIQTNDNALGPILVDQSTDTAAEHFVVVDGGYLNILFHNLTLPQIFSSGKQYEVNEEALRNIVISANTHNSNLNDSDVVEKFIDQIKNRDKDRSSTPSTARSLVEEFDQYYKGLADEDKSNVSPDSDCSHHSVVYESNETSVKASKNIEKYENHSVSSTGTMTNDANELTFNDSNVLSVDQYCECEASIVSVETQSVKGKDSVSAASQMGTAPMAVLRQTGPLPVPAGAASDTPSTPIWLLPKSSTTSTTSAFTDPLRLSTTESSSASSQPLCPTVSSMSSMTSPALCEAEELRRQQLAIEREIKALEQQQCQLLVVREIPDKPPPPYTPPTEKQQSPPRMFVVDNTTEDKIHRHTTDPEGVYVNPTDTFDVFVKDYCLEAVEKQRTEQSDKPWDSCNLLPQKPDVDAEQLVKKISSELKEVLTGVAPTVVSGVGSRRSDHIDDILFAEWRRCEPEWTALHSDEAAVKNQVFESIFQKILTETIDEYKRTVLGIHEMVD